MHRLRPRFRSGVVGSLIGALVQAVPVCAWAETQVDGQSDAIRLEVHGAPLAEVLDALGSRFKLHYRTSTALTQAVTGTYEGSLQYIVARVLDGYDRVIKSSDDGLDVFIYSPNKGAAVVAASNTAAPPPTEDGKPADAPAAPAKTPPAIAISTPNAPVVAPWPPPPPPNQDSVVGMLGAAARSQIPGAGTAPPAGNAPGGAGMPSAADIAALTQSASAMVQNLAAQLSRLPH